MQPTDSGRVKSFVPPAFSKPVGLDRKRIAVLPFTNISPDPQDSYFAEGLTEELITTLCQLHGLQVIARTSTSQYVGTSKSVSQIGTELQAGSVVEGSVRKSGNKIRVTTQLIETVAQAHLWAEQYDRDLIDIFLIQSDIAKHIANGLSVALLSGEETRIEKRETESVAAHIAYLKGRTLLHDRSEKALRDALGQFELAIKNDPNYARAYAALADTYNILGSWTFASRAECLEKSKVFVKKALELDQNLPEAHVSLALIHRLEYRFSESAEEYKRAIALIPSDATAHRWYSSCLLDLGRQKEALSEILRAEELDPLSMIINSGALTQFLFLGDDGEVLKRLQKAREIDPEGPITLSNMAFYYEFKSDYDQALACYNKIKEIWPGSLYAATANSEIGWIYAVTNRRREAMEIAERMQADFNAGIPTVGATEIAGVYLGLDDLDECFKWLEKAYDAHEDYLYGAFRFNPQLENARRDPRFNALLKKANLPIEPVK